MATGEPEGTGTGALVGVAAAPVTCDTIEVLAGLPLAPAEGWGTVLPALTGWDGIGCSGTVGIGTAKGPCDGAIGPR